MAYRFAGPRQAGAYTYGAEATSTAWASHRHGQALLTGAYTFGGGGLGTLGARIPGSGTHGPSYLFNDLTLPADAATEVRGVVLTPPTTLSQFFAYEDGSFIAAGPDGVHTFTYALFADGQNLGVATVTLNFGA